MNKETRLEVFEKEEFGSIRLRVIDGDIFFNLGDISKVLGLRPADIKKRLFKGGVLDSEVDKLDNGVFVPSVYVSEPNFYRCVMKSKKTEAERFQSWVVEEVLPSIRKHGAYIAGEKLMEVLNDPNKMIEILTDLVKESPLGKMPRKNLMKSVQRSNIMIKSLIVKT